MVIYSKNDNYKIWVNTKDKTFHIQMNDKETEEDGYSVASEAIRQAEQNLPEVVVTLTKCSTPQTMKCPLCEECIRNQPSTQQLEDYEQFSPKKAPMRPWKCDGYVHKNQKSLL